MSWASQVVGAAYNATHGEPFKPTPTNPIRDLGQVADDANTTYNKLASFSAVNTGSIPSVGGSQHAPAPSVGGLDLLGYGSLVSAGANIVGGLLGYRQQKKANAEAKRQFDAMLAFQKDQYYNATKNRVADAARAGIHPLAALGINPHGSASPTAHVQAATGLGNAVQAMSHSADVWLENRIKSAQLSTLDSQIAVNKALAVKYAADANRATADTDYIRKDIANYHIYRGINSAVNAIGAIGGVVNTGVRNATMHYGAQTDRYRANLYRYDLMHRN